MTITELEKQERMLGPQEALFAEFIRRSNGGIQIISLAEFAAPMPADRLKEGLKRLHQRHPMLRSRIEMRDDPWWCCDVPFDHIDISTKPMLADFDIEAVYAAEACRVIDFTRTAWRATLLTDENLKVRWLVFVCNHAAIDGRSTLQVLNELDIFLTTSSGLLDHPLPLRDTAEQGLNNAGYTGETELFRPWPEETKWPVEIRADSGARVPHATLRVLPAENTEALHRFLHGQGICLAAAFCVAAIRAASMLPGATDWTGLILPVDIRNYCAPAIPQEAVGEYVSTLDIMVGPESRSLSLLELAREVNQELDKKRLQALYMDNTYDLGTVHEIVDQFAAANDVFPNGICVSDMGDINRLSGRPVGISRILLMPSQNHGAHSIMVAVISTSQGVNLSFGYSEPLTSQKSAEIFIDSYMKILMEMSNM